MPWNQIFPMKVSLYFSSSVIIGDRLSFSIINNNKLKSSVFFSTWINCTTDEYSLCYQSNAKEKLRHDGRYRWRMQTEFEKSRLIVSYLFSRRIIESQQQIIYYRLSVFSKWIILLCEVCCRQQQTLKVWIKSIIYDLCTV